VCQLLIASESILKSLCHFILGQQSSGGSTATLAMRIFDKKVAAKVEESMGRHYVKKLSYKVAKEGVAVNDNGTGFAEVFVTARDRHGQRDLTFMTAILKLAFVPESSKLKSIVWHITEEHFDQPSNGEDSDCLSCASGESLGCQTSFPSVVSLDQSGDAADGKPPAEDGPGMHFLTS